MLTNAIALQFSCHPDFIVLVEVPIPISTRAVDTAARERKRRKKGRSARKSRKGSTRTRPTKGSSVTLTMAPDHSDGAPVYMADIVLLDRHTGTIWVIESKRDGGQSDAAALAKISDELHAVQMCMPSWLEEIGVTEVETVKVAILDHLGQCGSDPDITIKGGEFDAAFGIAEIDAFTGRVHRAVAKAARPVLARLLRRTTEDCRVGSTRRIDQAVSEPLLLVFAIVEPAAVDRLGPTARSYFRPQVADRAAARTLLRATRRSCGPTKATFGCPGTGCGRSTGRTTPASPKENTRTKRKRCTSRSERSKTRGGDPSSQRPTARPFRTVSRSRW